MPFMVVAYLESGCHDVHISASRVVATCVGEDQLHICAEFRWACIQALVSLAFDSPQVHRLLDGLQVVSIPCGVDWVVEDVSPLHRPTKTSADNLLLGQHAIGMET